MGYFCIYCSTHLVTLSVGFTLPGVFSCLVIHVVSPSPVMITLRLWEFVLLPMLFSHITLGSSAQWTCAKATSDICCVYPPSILVRTGVAVVLFLNWKTYLACLSRHSHVPFNMKTSEYPMNSFKQLYVSYDRLLAVDCHYFTFIIISLQ